MNTQSMGPRLQLAPEASHGDRFLDVVLVKEEGRLNLEFFLKQQKGANQYDNFHMIKAKDTKIRSNQPTHVDDQIVELEDLSET